MARFTTMRSQSIGPAIAGLLLVALLVIGGGMVMLHVAPPIHGPPGLGEPAREFLRGLFPAQPLPDQHPQVARHADGPKGR